MPDDSADTDRIEQLTDRIDRLESVVAAQQETITEQGDSSTLGTWGRRGVLGSIAAGLGLSAASGSAAAGVGDLGTPSERVDAFLDQADVNALDAGNVSLGSYQVEEDDNSPLTIDNAKSGSISLSKTYEAVKLIALEESSAAIPLQIEINGDRNANYDYFEFDGTQVTGATAWEAVKINGKMLGQETRITGTWADVAAISTSPQSENPRLLTGTNSAVSSPLDSITIRAGVDVSCEIAVLGVEKQ